MSQNLGQNFSRKMLKNGGIFQKKWPIEGIKFFSGKVHINPFWPNFGQKMSKNGDFLTLKPAARTLGTPKIPRNPGGARKWVIELKNEHFFSEPFLGPIFRFLRDFLAKFPKIFDQIFEN